METEPGILHAFSVDGQGGGKMLRGAAISKHIRSTALAWVHLDANIPETRGWLEKEIAYLDEIILDALLAEETRPRILEFDRGALLILRGVNLNENAEPEDMVSIRLWADEHRIISIQRRNLKAVHDIKSKLEQGTGPKNTAEFLTGLITRLFDRMEPVLAGLDEQADTVEERVMETPDADERRDIIDLRRQAILLRRYMLPQRDVIAHLRVSDLPWIAPDHKRRLQENLDRITRYLEDLDTVRERAQIIKDELTNALSDQMNKNLYMLSLVAAIFLPLGFLTGLLGINVGGIPGADHSGAFYIFCGLLLLVVTAQILIFRALKWL